MKKFTILTVAALLAASLSVSAQDGNRRKGNRKGTKTEMRMNAKERTNRMAKELNLSADETVKVQALFEKEDAKRAEQITKTREQRDKNREEMKALRDKRIAEKDAELEKIIGKEKMEKYKNLRQERMNLRKDKRKASQ